MTDEGEKGTTPMRMGEGGEGRWPATAAARGGGKGKRGAGYVLSGLAILFMLFDAVGKLAKPPQVTEAFVRLGVPMELSMEIGILLLVCTALYAIPRTAVLGAIVLTAFLGGAVAIQMRAGSPVFETVFPVIFGVIMWAGILLREDRLREIFPIRCRRCGD